MELKIQVNEETGKIKNIIVDVDKVDPAALKAVFRVIKEELGTYESNKAPQPVKQPAQSLMSKDIEDLSSNESLTIMDRLKLFVRFEFHGGWFNSLQVKERYDAQYNKDIKISTVSTYLSRMCGDGFLERKGNRVSREYRAIDAPEAVPETGQSPGLKEN